MKLRKIKKQIKNFSTSYWWGLWQKAFAKKQIIIKKRRNYLHVYSWHLSIRTDIPKNTDTVKDTTTERNTDKKENKHGFQI